MHGFLAGAFDRFANAHALACELHSCGFDDANVRITGNPSNPDAVFGVSLSAESRDFPVCSRSAFPTCLNSAIRRLADPHSTPCAKAASSYRCA